MHPLCSPPSLTPHPHPRPRPPIPPPPPPVPDTQVGEGKPGFFAISSAPDPNNQGLLEFLIKAQGEAAEAVAALQAGETESRGTMSITP
jgi:hypothetical protein